MARTRSYIDALLIGTFNLSFPRKRESRRSATPDLSLGRDIQEGADEGFEREAGKNVLAMITRDSIPYFIETRLDDWKKIYELDKYFMHPFVYRGQSNSAWEISSSIERAMLLSKYSTSSLAKDYTISERWMLHDFKRKYPLYSNLRPLDSDHCEWLAIMQHHGAPTRLVDFTESVFIGAYFAIMSSTSDAAVWAVDRLKLRDNIHIQHSLPYEKGVALLDEINLTHLAFANGFIRAKDTKLETVKAVVPFWPKIFNQRLLKQQGLFLMPADATSSFFENLVSSFDSKNTFEFWDFDKLVEHSKDGWEAEGINLIKIIIPKRHHCDIAEALKEMNITAESLFPGIDGMAQSLIQLHIRT
jgi:hypothetical protein